MQATEVLYTIVLGGINNKIAILQLNQYTSQCQLSFYIS